MTPMLFDDDELAACFNQGVLLRGKAYWYKGAVLHCDVQSHDEGLQVEAVVLGSGTEPYTLSATVARHRNGRLKIGSHCDCPMTGGCKHVVAALLEVREQQGRAVPENRHAGIAEASRRGELWAAQREVVKRPAASALPLPFSTGLEEPRAPPLPPALEQWLGALARVSNAAPVNEGQCLVYELGHPLKDGTLGLRLKLVRLLKTGGFSEAKPWNNVRAAAWNPPRFVREDDKPILRRLDQCLFEEQPEVGQNRHLTATTYRLQASAGAQLLALLLQTRRCYWLDHRQGEPLTLASPREGRWQWLELDDGGQQLRLLVTPAAEVIACAPPWYVDAEKSRAGEVHNGLPDALAALLAAAPAVPHGQVGAIGERLGAQLGNARFPLPGVDAIETRGDIVPQPILRLYSDFGVPGYGRSPSRDQGAAQLWFDYQGQRLRPQDTRAALTRRKGENVFRIERQKSEEDRRFKELTRLSLLRKLQACFQHWEISAATQFDLSIPRPREQEEGWQQFQIEVAPQLIARGWQIEYDPSFVFRHVEIDHWYGEINALAGDDDDSNGGPPQDWFGLQLGIVVEGAQVNLLPILIAALQSRPQDFATSGKKSDAISLTLPDGRRVALPQERVAPLINTLIELAGERPLADGALRLSRFDAARLADIEAANPQLQAHWLGGEKLRALGSRLSNFKGISAVAPSPNFHAELRPYQREGLNWLQFLRTENLAGILADDMGLGKTVQTLAHLLVEKEQGRLTQPVLIVAPTSLMGNWRREAEKFAPGLRVLTLHGLERKGRHSEMAQNDLILTTYALLRFDEELLLAQDYSWLILDEAQNIKNATSATAKVARKLRAQHRLCLTGTPLENHLGELWSQYHFLMPGLLGDSKTFTRLYRNPIEKHGDAERRKRLNRRTAPFLLRRTKQQVLRELPPKTEIIRSVTLEGAQRDLYETVRLAMDEKLRGEIARLGLDRSRIIVLDALLKLRQVCCDPRLVKLTAARKARESAKLELLMDLLPAMIEEGRKVLLFSQFTSMLELIEPRLAALGIHYLKLTGESKNREALVDRFQTGQAPLFLLSLKAGGVGLNLTAADTVIHYDPWWNPAVENQATDRAHRIGQDKPVFVYKLVVEGSVEERIQALQAKKAALFAGVVGDAETEAAPKFTQDDLAELLRPLA